VAVLVGVVAVCRHLNRPGPDVAAGAVDDVAVVPDARGDAVAAGEPADTCRPAGSLLRLAYINYPPVSLSSTTALHRLTYWANISRAFCYRLHDNRIVRR